MHGRSCPVEVPWRLATQDPGQHSDAALRPCCRDPQEPQPRLADRGGAHSSATSTTSPGAGGTSSCATSSASSCRRATDSPVSRSTWRPSARCSDDVPRNGGCCAGPRTAPGTGSVPGSALRLADQRLRARRSRRHRAGGQRVQGDGDGHLHGMTRRSTLATGGCWPESSPCAGWISLPSASSGARQHTWTPWQSRDRRLIWSSPTPIPFRHLGHGADGG
jgi:hypothetical protein